MGENNDVIYLDGMLLLGKEAIIIPCLAVIGGATVMGGAVYGGFKLAKWMVNRLKKREPAQILITNAKEPLNGMEKAILEEA